ncbi:MAG: glycosyltransferase family 4 protein [Acidobacteriaceae bacterium]|jgi:glycosyltransferase involved in cell wall biosynthesis|nr:glycosyltransferase family 4 protein [Acidobacteriaceae bacterium]
MKIAFIVQRYGSEVLGGAEQLCRLLAEQMVAHHDVEVVTTCARDYITWKNEYAEGTDRIRGVTVRRFATARTRDIDAFNKYSDWIFNNPHSRADEMEWLKQQGPWSPALIEYLRRHQQHYDVLVFFTYLYAPTVLGLEVNPGKSILIPTAHDEPAIHLDIFKEVFAKVGALCYLTGSERDFVQHQFPQRPLLEELVGVGVDMAHRETYPRLPPPPDPTLDRREDGEEAPAEEDTGSDLPSHLRTRGSVFRRRHRLDGPIVLYGGRIDPGKGCEELLDYFGSFISAGGQATLALMGAKMMSLPEEPYLRFAGMLSDTDRVHAFEAATIVVCPSPYESLSLLALEAMSTGTPVLVNGRSSVLVEHCVRSNAGLWYEDRDEFVEALMLLLADDRLRATLGANGREYVREHYRWDVVLARYESLFAKIRHAR